MKPIRDSTTLIVWMLLVAVLSLVAASLPQSTEFLRAFLAAPGIVALFGVLLQLFRDSQSHQRTLEIQARQQDYVLGTATHMAEVAYDKHVEFCEAYIERVNAGLGDLFVHGPEEIALQFATDLRSIRLRYRAWLTQEIEDSLIPFEQSLREIGANREYLRSLPTGEERSEIVRAMYDAFRLAMDIDAPTDEEQKAKTSAHIIDALRGILGIRELTMLRQATTRVAIERLTSSS